MAGRSPEAAALALQTLWKDKAMTDTSPEAVKKWALDLRCRQVAHKTDIDIAQCLEALSTELEAVRKRHIDLSLDYSILREELEAEKVKVAEARNALAIVAAAKDNEITSHPYWLIIDPRQMMSPSVGFASSMVKGLFFSRERATECLESHRYRYSDKAGVFCFSGNNSPEYRDLYNASLSLQSTPPAPVRDKDMAMKWARFLIADWERVGSIGPLETLWAAFNAANKEQSND